MNKTVRNLGLVALAALLYKPTLRFLNDLNSRRERDENGSFGEDEGELRKTFANSYRGRHKPHHRHAKLNGHRHVSSH